MISFVNIKAQASPQVYLRTYKVLGTQVAFFWKTVLNVEKLSTLMHNQEIVNSLILFLIRFGARNIPQLDSSPPKM